MMAAPPLVGDWWQLDHDVIVNAALAAMRLTSVSEPDLQRVSDAANTAGRLIDERLDRCTPLPVITPGPIVAAAVEATIVLYRRKDAPFGTAGGWADQTVTTPIYSDPLEGVYPLIAPWRERVGVA
jgi:hypothetical protein